jgi:predicted nucleic acid-binding protein
VLSALLWRGTPYQLLTNIRDQAESISLACSAPLLAELADVLTRPPATVRLALIQRSAADVLADYTAIVEIVTPLPVPRIAPDPGSGNSFPFRCLPRLLRLQVFLVTGKNVFIEEVQADP